MSDDVCSRVAYLSGIVYDRPAYAIGEHAGENDKSPEQEEEYIGGGFMGVVHS